MPATLDALYSERNILRKVQSESAQMNERAEKVADLRKESTNSVPCGHEGAVQELTIPGADTRTRMTNKLRPNARGENTCLNCQ